MADLNIPGELAERPQWLVFKFEKRDGKEKLDKIPYYVSGIKRNGAQGSPADRSSLCLASAALAALARGKFDGVGFALLPGDGLVGVDLDGVVDIKTGAASERAAKIVEACASYTEYSPSKAGLHIIARGNTKTFKDNDAGIEVFCGSQFLTFTGDRFPNTTERVNDISPQALAHLRSLVDEAKEAKKKAPGSLARNGANGHSDDRAKLETALAYINSDCGYDEWIRVGMAIHAEMGDAGFSAWDHWSGKGSKYPGSRALEAHWKSFDSTGGVTAATIYKQAQDAGWRAPQPQQERKTFGKFAGRAKDEALPEGETALELMECDIPEPQRRCDPWATEGLNLVVSRPKLGKTTLLRQKAAALAVGGTFLGEKCEVTPSIFLSLEEGRRLMRSKFKRAGFPDDALSAIRIFYEWPRGAAGVEQLEGVLAKYPYVGYVVIDSLSRFRTVPDSKTPAFIADYEAMSMLHTLSKKRPGLVMDVIHHSRKSKSDDAIDDISGTYGLSAACDSYCVLRWHEEGAVMYVGGRLWDREESDFQLRRGNHRWELVGAHGGLTAEQQRTLELVKAAGAVGIGGQTLAEKLGIGKQAAWERLTALVAKGVATKLGGVVYAKT